jgi:hypothetical protein
MKIVFESVLLFSLAVLVIAVGLLVYYFKTRISDLENKNTKCLEIVNDIYSQHNQLKVNVEYLANRSSQPEPAMTYYRENGDNIQFHVAEDDYDDNDDNEEGDDYDEDDVKIVNVDLSGPVDSDINISDEIEDTDPYDNVEVDELAQAKKPTIVKIDVHDSDLESDNESRLEVDNESRTEVDNDSRSEAFRELFNPATKDVYKKMDVRSLRQLVITRGLATDNTARMKKNELIDILLTIV